MGQRNSSRALRRLGGHTAIVVAAMLSQCVCQNNRPDDPHATGAPPPPPVEATGPAAAVPASLEGVSALDADERRALADVLGGQYDPCGGDRSFLDSLRDPDTCELARTLGRLAVRRVSQGVPARRIIRELLEERARRAAHAELDLEGVPHLGDRATARHVIVEFTDFECGYCRDAAEPVKALARTHDAALYVKMFPIEERHAHARAAALAALAAHRQGRFWEAHDALFASQDRWTNDASAIRSLLADAGLDMRRFDADVASDEVAAALTRDLAEAARLGVRGTPTFFVDGYLVDRAGLEAALAAPRQP